MTTEAATALAWLAFGGTHIAMSSLPVRRRLISALTLRGFKGLYSLVAIGTFGWLMTIYWGARHEGALLFDPPVWMRHVAELAMLPALLFVVLAQASSNPATTLAELGGRRDASPRGIHRVTRHPLNTGFAIFGIAHMLVNPTVGDWIFWGGFPVFAVVSAWHQDRRLLASDAPGFRDFHAATSFVPFGAIVSGRQRLAGSEIRWGFVAAAVAVWGLVRWVHPSWIGGFS